ncbi:type I-E CRISPR-associated protein Cas7/Cse4/CasC [Pluralibacter gergoviae]|uniref:type I-E CRISPR-associated protein Cas7/Cse4/CasC n=1 Tax=Pluralibacter gergoviae TaxID=61647 RepID=UPI0006510280|nr:type I-E CRISPR-associated protein Cas7/Cse4/CasC [Pluralibacter gergoviae]EKW9968867.1 type I-E CRISPR-associated protein Cas7/Cse4/CasC [Pluralibacter gergoviae]ELD4301354.1 type I-E CRISPR-associated protein Cas7/Cse4/CasC [Pluralibacter gergoviae]ELN2737996.1 type I-E CRISPR-associated protein Cas7/Cse4/CasC [Pluralibacter gergoviae]KMK32582.1 CRISPR-associated protein Cse4 [Pluralibacter gergoviae]
MTTFIQLHFLTAYAPANLNRDDSGRPKTAIMGGVDRLRVSSQSLKRAWRVSEAFYEQLGENTGKRTQRIGRDYVFDPMVAAGISDKKAKSAAEKIASQFGKLKSDKKPTDPKKNLETEQLVHISNHEIALIESLVATLIADDREPNDEELKLLRKDQQSVDIAMFGRMLASSPEFNVEAACQVSHALGVSAVTVESDFFTAVDDLNKKEQDAGSAHMGEQGFASALFYTYLCINRDLLVENLGGDEALAKRAIVALTKASLTIAPTGKQNSFASRAYASYALAEIGQQQPRSLAAAFFTPVRGEDQIQTAIQRLEAQRDSFEKVYGKCADDQCAFSVPESRGSLDALLTFVGQ